LLWSSAVHCTNPCTTSAAGHVQRTESARRRPPQAVGDPNGVGDDDEGSESLTAGHGASKRPVMMSRMPLSVGSSGCFMWKLMETRTCTPRAGQHTLG
jgi:hypothetical protein